MKSKIRLFILISLFLFSKHMYCQNLLNGPNDIVFDQLNNRYLVSCWAGNNIVAVDVQGNHSIFMNNITNAHGSEIKDSILLIASRNNLLLIDLNSSLIINSINVPESEYLAHIALDSSNNVYITDWSVMKLFKISLSDDSVSTLATMNEIPGGICFDENNSRLILLKFVDSAPLLAVSLPGGNISTIRATTINMPDAICRDTTGYYYISSFTDNIIYQFNDELSDDPEIISTGHNGPSGLGYNVRDNILGVTNYDGNNIDLIDLGTTDIESEKNSGVNGFNLKQNFPNPFNPITTIEYSISKRDEATLIVYDVLGSEIVVLVNEVKGMGSYTAEFNAAGLASGIYFYHLKAGNFSDTKKMVIMK